MKKIFILVLFSIFMFTACAPAGEVVASQGSIEVLDAWARSTADGQSVAGAFMTIRNTGEAADRLLSASSDAAGFVEVHEMKMEAGVMNMAEVAGGLEVPAGASLALKPGGYHIMLIDLNQPLAQGQVITITLEFEQAGAMVVPVQVVNP